MEDEVAVVLPAHDEAATIGPLVSNLKKIFSLVVVVDDGSEDNTGKLAEKAGAWVIRHQHCQGKGAALKAGFKQALRAGMKAVITMDADGQHSVEEVHRFISAWRRNPEVGIWLGERNLGEGKMPWLRRITNRMMSLLLSLMAGRYMPDTQNGYRLIRREVLEAVHLTSDHFETESELLLKASWQGFKVSSLPVSTHYGGEKSKIRPGRDTCRFFVMIARILLEVGSGKWRRRRTGF